MRRKIGAEPQSQWHPTSLECFDNRQILESATGIRTPSNKPAVELPQHLTRWHSSTSLNGLLVDQFRESLTAQCGLPLAEDTPLN